jgi:hypothetical protein
MAKNLILDELRMTREKLLAEAGGTLEGLVARLQRDERQSGRAFALPRRPPTADPSHGNAGDPTAP